MLFEREQWHRRFFQQWQVKMRGCRLINFISYIIFFLIRDKILAFFITFEEFKKILIFVYWLVIDYVMKSKHYLHTEKNDSFTHCSNPPHVLGTHHCLCKNIDLGLFFTQIFTSLHLLLIRKHLNLVCFLLTRQDIQQV